MTIRLDAAIEHWSSEHILYARELPGFLATGSSSADLHRRSGDALQAHLDWLVARDLIDEPAGPVELSMVEEDDANSDAIGPRLMMDLIPPDDAEIETALAVGRAALSDLIDMFEVASRSGETAGDSRLLQRIAQRDAWFGSRLSGSQPALVIVESADPIDLLVHAAGSFEDEVDQFVLASKADLFLRDGEEWTLAKVLRRRTGHLRHHLSQSRSESDFGRDE
jgi:hypothetical protein